MQLKNESGMIVLSLTQFLFAPYWHYLIELNRINTPPLVSRLPNQVRGVEWQIF
jgi:hypothetical protein